MLYGLLGGNSGFGRRTLNSVSAFHTGYVIEDNNMHILLILNISSNRTI